VGWEPNPGLSRYLSQLESHFKSCGHRVIINKELGVGIQNSVEKFVRLEQEPLLLWNYPMEMPSQFASEDEIKNNKLFR